jgi:hypothetical protein
MDSTNRDYWSTVISPQLRALVSGITDNISKFVVEKNVPMAVLGDFFWFAVCIAANAPRAHLDIFQHARPAITGDMRLALLWCACDAGDFYGFPPNELSRLFKRLNRNVEEAEVDSDELEAHTMIRDRIEDVILSLVEKHPRYAEWLNLLKTERAEQHAPPCQPSPPHRGHLRLLPPLRSARS